MAKIPDFHEIGRPDYRGASMITAHDSGAMAAPGRATSELGQSIASAGKAIGAALGTLEGQNNKQQDMQAAMDFANFQQQQDDTYARMERDMPEDGTGFREGYSQQYFDSAKGFLSDKIPDRLKQEYDFKLRQHHISYERRAREAEYGQQDKYTVNKLTGSLGDLSVDIDENTQGADPDRLDRTLERGSGVIDASPLPPNRKLELKKEFTRSIENKYFDARRRHIQGQIGKPGVSMEDIDEQLNELEKESKTRSLNAAPDAPEQQSGQPGAGDISSEPLAFEPAPFQRTVGRARQGKIAGFVVHETQGSDTANGNLSWSNKKNTGANYYIDKNGKIIQWAPDDVVMNHAGVGRGVKGDLRPDLGNNNTLSVEIMTRPGEKPNKAQTEAANRLIRAKAQEYGLKPEDIEGHGRLAPGHKEVTEGTAVVDYIRQNWGGTAVARVDTGAEAGEPAKPLPANIDRIVDSAAKDGGIDPNLMRAYAHIESSGDPNASTGQYKGLFQLSDAEFRKYGGRGSPYNAEANARAAAAKIKAESAAFEEKYGKAPTASELYLIHQQGEAGAEAHWDNPDRPAWKNMLATGEGRRKGAGWAKRAIWGNLPDSVKQKYGSVENVSSADFVAFWDKRVQSLGGGSAQPEQPADAYAEQKPLPMEKRGMTAFAGLSNDDDKPTRVASLDPRMGLGGPMPTPGEQAVTEAGLPTNVTDLRGQTAASLDPKNQIATILDGMPDDKPISQVAPDVRDQVFAMFPRDALKPRQMPDGTTKSALDVMTIGEAKEALASQLRETKRLADANGGYYPQKATFNHLTEADRGRMSRQIATDRRALYDKWADAEADRIASFGEGTVDKNGETLMERASRMLQPAEVMKIKKKLDTARGIFDYVQPIKSLSDDEIDETLQALKPSPDDTPEQGLMKSSTRPKAEAEATRIRSLRSKDFAAAVGELPDVRVAMRGVQEAKKSLITGTDAQGNPVYTEDKQQISNAQRQAWETVIQARLDAQENITGDGYNPNDTASQFRLLTRKEKTELFGNVRWNKLSEQDQLALLKRAAGIADQRYGKFARQAFNEAVQQVVSGADSLDTASAIGANMLQKIARDEAVTNNDVNRYNDLNDLSPMETFARGGLPSTFDFSSPAGDGRRLTGSGPAPASVVPGIGQAQLPPDTSATQMTPMSSDQAGLTTQAPQKALMWLMKDPTANMAAFDRMYGAGTAAQIIKLMSKLQAPQAVAQ